MPRVPNDPILRSAVARALAVAAAGCAPHAAPVSSPAPAPTPLSAADGCALGAWAAPGGDLTPGRPIDALLLRVDDRSYLQSAGKRTEVTLGRPCGTATDEAACTVALATSWPAEGAGLVSQCGQIGCVEHHLVWTAGNEVGLVADRDALLALLAPIDTADEARLVAWVDGYTPSCGAAVTTDAGTEIGAERMVSDCPIEIHTYGLTITATGETVIRSDVAGEPGACIGRFPQGLVPSSAAARTTGAWLARAAHLEAASVAAFRRLARELRAHGAPPALVAAAREAALDEVRHARRVRALALARGARPAPVRLGPLPVRDLAAIALENAVEGCARETWGAVVGAWQARHAQEQDVRSAMGPIAADELRHAELSRAVDRWIRPRLSPTDRRRVDTARRRAWRRLGEASPTALAPAIATALGLPGPNAAALRAALGPAIRRPHARGHA